MHAPSSAPARPLQYVQRSTDRHGRPRNYLRRKGHKLVPLPGEYGSPEFLLAHAAAMAVEPLPIVSRADPDTISALIASFYNAPEYPKHPSTRRAYTRILERFREAHGSELVADFSRKRALEILSRMADRPAATNELRKLLRMAFEHAVAIGMRGDNPIIGTKRIKIDNDGHPDWTDDQLAQFDARHRPGTQAHLAMSLFICTSQRIGDVVKLGWGNVRNGTLSLVQEKRGRKVVIPVLPRLQAAIAGLPRDAPTFLLGEYGKPFSKDYFRGKIATWVKQAGLSGVSAHGLRKATLRHFAEAGFSAPEIAAWSGHKNLKEIERYIEAANRAAWR